MSSQQCRCAKTVVISSENLTSSALAETQSTIMRTFFLAALLITTTTSLEIKSGKDNDDVDRFAQLKVKPIGAYVGAAAVVSLATGVQVATPGWMRNTFGSALDGGLGAAALNFIETCEEMKSSNPLGLTLGHGLVTKACADLLAQTIPQQALASAWIDPLRLFRSTLASVLSTSLPFYFWTRFMARR